VPVPLNDISSDKESYTAHLTLPRGSGPFPVVVLSHGRGGAKRSHYGWGRQITEWGFAAIAMDHYTPRGHMKTRDSFDARRDDLISILKVIKDDKRLDNANVTLAGWSRGAGFVGHGIWDQEAREEAKLGHPIKSAVLFYPQSTTFFRNFDERFNLPVIFLTGSEDYIWFSGWKRFLEDYKNKNHPLVLKLYEGQFHNFDVSYFRKKRCRDLKSGPHCLLYDKDTHQQSIKDLKAFLTKYAQ
jgi:dienelactone hydrolase